MLPALRCPLRDGSSLTRADGVLRCGHGHAFDLARQGYVNLLPGGAASATADTADMVQARERFLATGAYDALADALALEVAATVGPGPPAAGAPRLVLDLGTGTGFHLARVLDRLPEHVGLGLDLSKYAARRAARAHARIGAAVADAWRPLPVATAAAEVVLNVFAPRRAAEIDRVLAPGGALLVATPTGRHLWEVVGPLGLLGVEDDKQRRLASAVAPHLLHSGSRVVEYPMELSRETLRDLVRMGPSAWHVDAAEVTARTAALPPLTRVTASFTLSTFRRPRS